jgi:predicted dehydrogenase
MNSGPVRVGVVGLGAIADVHLTVLAENPAVELAFTVDPRPDACPSFRGAVPRHYLSLGEALGDGVDVDLIVIAAPTSTHADLVAEAAAGSPARILVEKPLAHDTASLARLDGLARGAGGDLASRVFVAHHFAFSPEVRWAAEMMARLRWGPVTGIMSAFYDPYVGKGERAFESYGSAWLDSGSNQLSMLSRFVDFAAVTSAHDTDGGASTWRTASFRSGPATGTARLRVSWLTGSSSKRTTLSFGDSGIECWLDHTAMTAFAAQGDDLLASFGTDGRTPRKLAHYRPLYESLLSDAPDDVLSFTTGVMVTSLLHAGG